MPHKWLSGNFYLQKGSLRQLSLFRWWRMCRERRWRTVLWYSHTAFPESSRGLFLPGLVAERLWWRSHEDSKRHSKGCLVWIGFHPLPESHTNPELHRDWGHLPTAHLLPPKNSQWKFVGVKGRRDKGHLQKMRRIPWTWAGGWVDRMTQTTKSCPRKSPDTKEMV